MINNETLKMKFTMARNKYKPLEPKCLFIAEAPPNDVSRFFYYPDVKIHDYLFIGIMGSLYPGLKKEYIDSKRPTYLKEELLRMFQKDGFFLKDLLDVPISMYPLKDLSNAIPSLITRISTFPKDVPIIMIKTSVYDLLYIHLRELDYNAIPVRIPFPSSGQQNKFANEFKKAMGLAFK